MEINIYWYDLIQSVREDLFEQGFVPSDEQLAEKVAIGILDLQDSKSERMSVIHNRKNKGYGKPS